MPSPRVLSCASTLFALSSLSAQTRLIADVNATAGRPLSSFPAGFVATPPLNGTCFSATTRNAGREPWLTDLSFNVRLLADVVPGPGSSDPEQFAVFANGVVTTLQLPIGRELAYIDATTRQTTTFDLRPGFASSAPSSLTASSGQVFFVADDGRVDRELWVLSGSPPTPRLLLDIRAGVDSEVSHLTPFPGGVVFIANDGVHGFELWASDGTTAGTRMVTDLNPGAGWGVAGQRPAVIGNQIWFAGNDGVSGVELFVTDGTAAGTRLVTDLAAGSNGSYPSWLTAMSDGRLAFAAAAGTSGFEPHITDGTSGGTRRLAVGGGSGSAPRDFGATDDGRFLFVANHASAGTEWHVSDGTLAGTRVLDLTPGPAGSIIRSPVVAGRRGFLVNAEHRLVAWDGTSNTTSVLTPMNVRVEGDPLVARFGGGIIFTATTASGTEPWVSDGTIAGTRLLADVEASPTTADALPRVVTSVGSRALFLASDGARVGLWATDGEAANTVRLIDADFTAFVIGETADAVVLAIGDSVVRTDGTPAGTAMIAAITALRSPFTQTHGARLGDGRIVFTASTVAGPPALWVSDGTAAGTQRVLDFDPNSNPPGNYVANGALAFFAAADSASGSELWVTDGSAAGTRLVRDIQPPNTPAPSLAGAINGRVVFSANDGRGATLWVSDGTVSGTSPLGPLLPWPLPGLATASFNGRLIVPTADGAIATDGTALGTTRLPVPSAPLAVVGLDNAVVIAVAVAGGVSLLRTDGTIAGTRVIGAPLSGGLARAFALSGSRAAFLIGEPLFGVSTAVIQTDGTTTETIVNIDLPLSALDRGALAANGRLMFRQHHPLTGVELWTTELGAAAQHTGVSCGDSSASLRLRANEPRLGEALTLRAPHSAQFTVFLFGSERFGALPGVPSCGLYIQPALPFLSVATPTDTLSLVVPSLAHLAGVRIATQAWIAPTAPLGFAASNGLLLTLDW